MQDTRLANLPDDASLPPPIGNLGPGAIYFAEHARHATQGETFLKQGFVTLRGAAASPPRVAASSTATALETMPGDATLA